MVSHFLATCHHKHHGIYGKKETRKMCQPTRTTVSSEADLTTDFRLPARTNFQGK